MKRRLGFPKASLLMIFTLIFMASLAAQANQTTIEYIYLAGADASEERQRALVEAFERANPDIKVERIRVISNYADRLTTLIATGTVPDVISMDMNYIMAFGDERFLQDLTPLIERTPEYEIEYVARPMLDVYTVDGKLFAAPSTANPTAYAFNGDLFNQSGLVSPYAQYVEGEWTWDAFRDAARKLTRKNPDGSFAVMGTSMHLPRTWMFSNGGQEVDNPHRPTTSYFSSSENIAALEFIQSMILEDDVMRGAGSPMTQAIGADDIIGFTQGRLGMTSRWMSFVPSIAEGAFDIGLVPYPKGPSPGGRHATDLGMFGLSISSNTENLEAAWRFVAFMTGPEGAAIGGDFPGMTPGRPADLYWLSSSVTNPEIYPDLLMNGTIRVISRDRADIQGIINGELSPVWSGTVPVENAVTEIDRRIQAYLQDNPQ